MILKKQAIKATKFLPEEAFNIIKNLKEEIDPIETKGTKLYIDILRKQIKYARELCQNNLEENLVATLKYYDKVDILIKEGYTTYIFFPSLTFLVKKIKTLCISKIEEFPYNLYIFNEETFFPTGSIEYNQALERKKAFYKIKKAKNGKIRHIYYDCDCEDGNLNYSCNCKYGNNKTCFDEIYIVHMNKIAGEQKIKTCIAFGFSKVFPEHLFFIAEWEQEFDSLESRGIIKPIY